MVDLGLTSNAPANFRAKNPTETPYHKLKTLIITLAINAVEMSIPCVVSKPASVPSVIPIPPGMKVIAPKITDVVKIDNTCK